jgi:NAD dependent epimerase/dehydratase family enzyme
VHRSDVVAAMLFLLERGDLSGPFNVTAPTPVTSRELCSALKRQLKTLVTLPMPAAAMRLVVGEMADELLITGQRVVPDALSEAGFEFRHADIDSALAASL